MKGLLKLILAAGTVLEPGPDCCKWQLSQGMFLLYHLVAKVYLLKTRALR